MSPEQGRRELRDSCGAEGLKGSGSDGDPCWAFLLEFTLSLGNREPAMQNFGKVGMRNFELPRVDPELSSVPEWFLRLWLSN